MANHELRVQWLKEDALIIVAEHYNLSSVFSLPSFVDNVITITMFLITKAMSATEVH